MIPKTHLPGTARGLVSPFGWLLVWALSLGCLPRAGSAEVRYRVVQLVTNEQVGAALSTATGINRFGDVCGYYVFNGTAQSPPIGLPFVYKDASGAIPLLITNSISTVARSINDNGQVALYGTPDFEIFPAYRYTPGVGFEPLGSLGFTNDDIAFGINNLGQVVGSSGAFNGTRPWEYGFLYTDGIGVASIGSLNENSYSAAYGINDLGEVTGISGGWAFIYTVSGGMVSIGQGVGYAINNQGIVAGRVGWSAAIYVGGETRLLTDNPDLDCEANDINNHNVVVGQIQSQPRQIFVWTERDGLMGLNSLIEPGWLVSWPGGINDNGQIAAEGGHLGDYPSAVRLDPIPPKLAIHHGSTNLVVAWSPDWPGVVLEATTSLREPDWQVVSTGGTNVFSVPAGGSSRFFRLNLDGLRGLCCAPE